MYVLLVGGVALFELLEYADLNLACVTVFEDGPDDLDSHSFVGLGVDGLDNLAKSTLSQ